MSLRNQPYLPLYIQDIMTDEKLNECSAATHGVYIKGIMCLMHKSKDYGMLLLKQKHKQKKSMELNLAHQLVKHLPYTIEEIQLSLQELIQEEVCFWEGDFFCQKRMIKDNKISLARSKSGKKGGNKTQLFAKAKIKANPENENENDNDNENENDNIDINRDKNIKEQNFRKNASLFSAEYSKEMIQDFCDYWTESNPNGKKLLYETKRTFDIKRRLSTWSKNNFNKTNYDRGKKARIDKVQEAKDFIFQTGDWAYKGEEKQ